MTRTCRLQAWKWKRAYTARPFWEPNIAGWKFFLYLYIHVFWWDSPASSRYPKVSVFWRWKRQNMYTLGRFRYESRSFQEVTGVTFIYTDIYPRCQAASFPSKTYGEVIFWHLKIKVLHQKRWYLHPLWLLFTIFSYIFPVPWVPSLLEIIITFTHLVTHLAKACRFQRHRSRGSCGLWLPLRGFWGWRWAGWLMVPKFIQLTEGCNSHSGKISITISTKGRSSKTQLSFKNP